MSDYEQVYRTDPAACGTVPFRFVAAFFDALPGAPLHILDVGCGQGRDSLYAARLGHRVLGIDAAATGVAQMVARARREKLTVRGAAVDIVGYAPDQPFDVVVCDRVLHCLPDPVDRQAVMDWMGDAVLPGGWLLVVEPRGNEPALERWFQRSSDWAVQRLQPGAWLAQKSG